MAGKNGPEIPREGGLDHSVAFLSEGYEFIGNRCRRMNTDIFRSRLLGTSFICVRGAGAAEMFYEPGVSRAGAPCRDRFCICCRTKAAGRAIRSL